MKTKTIFLFLVLMTLLSCKKESFASIHLKVSFQDKAKKELPRIYWISVLKNGKPFKKYGRFEKPRIEKEIIMDSLPNGTYKFVYENFLNQQMEKSIEINQSKIYEVLIHPDYSKYTDFIAESFVKNLKDNQKVELNFESMGCFHAQGYVVIVSKKEGEYYLQTRGVKKKMTRKEVDAVIKMECELNLLRQGGCTTKDHYVIKYQDQTKEYFDRTCAWEGWQNFFKQLNLKV